jgi:hypothetical protein
MGSDLSGRDQKGTDQWGVRRVPDDEVRGVTNGSHQASRITGFARITRFVKMKNNDRAVFPSGIARARHTLLLFHANTPPTRLQIHFFKILYHFHISRCSDF